MPSHGPPPPPDSDIRDAARLLRAITETSDDAIVAKTAQGIVSAWNPAAERIFGFTADEMIGQSIARIIPDDRLPEEAAIMERLLSGQSVSRFETVRRTKDGRLVEVEVSIAPVRNEAGVIIGATKIARDLTVRRRAEAALRAYEDHFRTLADNISQLAWMADSTGWIFWYNRRWFDYTGTTLESMQGWGWKAVHHPDHLARVVERLQKSWDTGVPWEDTFPLRGRDGAYRWFLSRALPITDATGRIVRWFGTNTDITEQRELEASLRRLTDELGDINRRKDAFLATLSHELRNPVGAIRTSVAVIGSAPGDRSVADRSIRVIERQSAHVARLLDDLLDVSRVSRDRIDLKPVDVDMAEVMRETVEAMRGAFDAAGVAFEMALPPGPLHARVDPARVQQMIGNLLSNAAKYTPPGGRVDLTVAATAETIVVTVRDTGVGIAPDMLDAIFGLFVQLAPDGYQSQHGLGIGLSLVKRLAELHGGAVTARSDGPGTGSAFELRLPRGDIMNTTPSRLTPPRVAAGARRVLLVDDDADSVEAFATYLEMMGHAPTVADSGETALALATQVEPDVVLMDIGLPGIDGYETCRRMRAMGVRAVIAALTGWGQHEDRRRTAEAGFDRHLVKPVNPDDVAQMIAEAPSLAMTRPRREA